MTEAILQTGVDVPLPSVRTVAIAVLFYLAGGLTPYYFAMERMRGFGRWVSGRIPYKAPPGMDKDEALKQALVQGKGAAAYDDDEIMNGEDSGEADESVGDGNTDT